MLRGKVVCLHPNPRLRKRSAPILFDVPFPSGHIDHARLIRHRSDDRMANVYDAVIAFHPGYKGKRSHDAGMQQRRRVFFDMLKAQTSRKLRRLVLKVYLRSAIPEVVAPDADVKRFPIRRKRIQRKAKIFSLPRHRVDQLNKRVGIRLAFPN